MHFDRRLWGLTRGLRWRIGLAAAVGLLAVPVAIWRLQLTAQALVRVFDGDQLNQIAGMLALVAILVLLRAGLDIVRDEIAHGTAVLMKARLREVVYRHVLRLGAGHFDQRRTGDAVVSLVDGVEQLDTLYGKYLPQMIIAGITPIILFAWVAVLDVRTALVYLFFALFTLIAPTVFHRANERASLDRRDTYNRLSADFLDSMQGLTTLKIFGQSRQRGEHLAARAREVFTSTMAVLALNIGSVAITMFGVSAGAATALIWGGMRVRDGSLETSTLFVVLLLGVEVFRPLRELTQLYHSGMVARAAANSLYQILDSEPEIEDPVDAEPLEQFIPEVRFESVSFGYNAGRRPALDGCSFVLQPGETLGVVGSSGAGKSTIVSLLLRFVDPQQGQVLLGGRDLRTIPLDDLRRHIAVVTQETYLFDGTIADNLRLGNPDASQAELEAAARLANAHTFIAALPDGYETNIGERGTRLSGGQRQRIAIARALLKDAPILILDEALSSVDAENEWVIQQALDRLQKGRTTLVIAHRLSSVVDADRIIVLDHGQVIEQGNHATLSKNGGAYAALMVSQQDAEREHAVIDPANLSDIATTDADRRMEAQTAPAPVTLSPDADAQLPMRTLWGRLFALVIPWRGELVLVIISGLLHALAVVGLGVASAILVGRVATGGDIDPWRWILAALVPLVALVSWLDVWLAHDLAYRLLTELRVRLYQALDRLAPAYLFRRRSGDLLSTATGDIELIELFYAHTIVPSMLAIVVPGGVLVTLGVIDIRLAFALLPFLILATVTPLIGNRGLERAGDDQRKTAGHVNAHMVDSIQGLRTIAAFGQGNVRTAEIHVNSLRLGELRRRFLRHQSIQIGAIESITAFGSLAVLTTGAWLVGDGDLRRTALPVATILAASAFGPVASIAIVAKELMQTVGASRRYFEIEDTPAGVEDGPGVALPDASGLPVTFENVTFHYTATTQPALRDVSFSIEAGQTVALVGGSGAGKTTIAHMLLRYWDPDRGRITIGGQDLRAFTLDDLRRQIALVAQDTYLFQTTLWENLRLGRPGASDAEVHEAARRANVASFASLLPDGYETQVGERGLQLSGGQRQRVAIARALLEDAPILILDEATSHLDAVNEHEVHHALVELQQGRTTLIIAHRLSTIRNADRILVLDNGQIVEQGTHQELLALDGLYSHLIGAQLRGLTERPQASTLVSDDD